MYHVRTDGNELLVVPRNLVNQVIGLAHDVPTSGHFGVRKTVN